MTNEKIDNIIRNRNISAVRRLYEIAKENGSLQKGIVGGVEVEFIWNDDEEICFLNEDESFVFSYYKNLNTNEEWNPIVSH